MLNENDLRLDIRHVNTARRSTVHILVDRRDVARITKRANDYKALPNKFRPALEKVGNYVRTEMIPEVFHKEGPGWSPLARRTLNDRKRLGYGRGPILQRTRDLYRELTEKSHPKHIEVIRMGKYARIELGGSSVKFIENQLGRVDRNLPARPMLPGTNGPIPARHQREIAKIFTEAITKGIMT